MNSKSSTTQLFNDLDDIYNTEPTYHNGHFVCPVCDKKYKKQKTSITHYGRRDCHKLRHVFAGTPVDDLIFKLYQKYNALSGNIGYSKIKFRKSQFYTPIAKTYMFCYENNVNMEDYFDYTIHEHRYESLAVALSYTRTESSLRKFRKEVAHEYTNTDKDEKFYNENRQTIVNNTSFTLRAIERGDISVNFLFKNLDFDEFVDSLATPQYTRFKAVLEREESK